MTIHPDSIGLPRLPVEEMNHLYMVENFLRKMLPEKAGEECALTVTLTNQGDVSVTLAAIKPESADSCLEASKELPGAVSKPEATDTKIVQPRAPAMSLFNPMSGVQDVVDSVNSKASNTAVNSYNGALNGVSKSSDEHEEGVSSAALHCATLVTLAIGVATGIFMIV